MGPEKSPCCAANPFAQPRCGPGSVVVFLSARGISIFALKFAKASGATVIIASSSDAKLERTRQLGTDLVVETVREATFARSLNAVAVGGTVFTIGFVTGTATRIDLLPILVKALRIVGNNTGSVADLAEATRAIAAHRIAPVTDRVFGIGETAETYAELGAGGRHFGKIAIVH